MRHRRRANARGKGASSPQHASGAIIHFLHIGKTGGSAIRHALEQAAPEIQWHGHDVTLRDIPVGEKVIFGIREPVSRFVSGFNSRLRMGRPKYDIPWTNEEEWLFRRFGTPNDLAEALFSQGNGASADGARAMAAIGHARPYSHWLVSPEYLRERSSDLVMILHQPTLSPDFEALRALVGLPVGLVLPRDPVHSHATPEGLSSKLSETGRANIARWYEADFPIYETCLSIRRDILGRTNGQRPQAETVDMGDARAPQGRFESEAPLG